jgi:hypothetical protein
MQPRGFVIADALQHRCPAQCTNKHTRGRPQPVLVKWQTRLELTHSRVLMRGFCPLNFVASSNFCGEQLAQVLVELTNRAGISTEKRKMAIDDLDQPELGIGNQPPLGLAIGRREEHVRRHWHDKVLALMRPNAARKSPPVWRLTSPRCHFHAMHSKSL